MKCKRPVIFPNSKGLPIGCGQCTHCTIMDRRSWKHRIILESLSHPSNSFLTLTYDNDHLPVDEYVNPKTGQIYAPFSVRPDHHRLFLNSLREKYFRLSGQHIRFFGIAEYGGKLERPHYHYALMNFPACKDGARYIGHRFIPCQCDVCRLVTSVWKKGHIFAGSLTLESAEYIAGYTTKKLTTDSSYRQDGYTGLTNSQKLAGRHPEFPRMSNRPGLGYWVAASAAEQLSFYNSISSVDIPDFLVHSGKKIPLGRYLSDKLREKMGKTYAEGERLKLYEASLRSMFFNPQVPSFLQKASTVSPDIALQLMNVAYNTNLEARQRLFRKDPIL